MLIRIPDDYKAIETLLGRNGIPFEIVEHKYKKALIERAHTLDIMEIIDINKIDVNELVEKAIKYIDEKMEINECVIGAIYNESLKHAYEELTQK